MPLIPSATSLWRLERSAGLDARPRRRGRGIQAMRAMPPFQLLVGLGAYRLHLQPISYDGARKLLAECMKPGYFRPLPKLPLPPRAEAESHQLPQCVEKNRKISRAGAIEMKICMAGSEATEGDTAPLCQDGLHNNPATYTGFNVELPWPRDISMVLRQTVECAVL